MSTDAGKRAVVTRAHGIGLAMARDGQGAAGRAGRPMSDGRSERRREKATILTATSARAATFAQREATV